MIKRQKYAVIRFLKQGNHFHMIHDMVMGNSVMEYAKEQIGLNKAEIVTWIQTILSQLNQYYLCGETKEYGYMNPYSFIVSETGDILLLDVTAEENQIWLDKMRKKKIRELFVRKEHMLSIKTDLTDDMYGLGKVIQFIVEKCGADNQFSAREQRIMRKIKKYCEEPGITPREAFGELKRLCEKLEEKEKKKAGPELLTAAIVLVVLGIFSCVMWESYCNKKMDVENLQAEMEYMQEQKDELLYKDDEKALELALLYWSLLGNEEEAIDYLKEAKDTHPIAGEYLRIQSMLNEVSLNKNEKMVLLKIVERVNIELEDDAGYKELMPLIRACERIDTAKSWDELRELCEHIKEKRSWGEGTNAQEKKIEILNYLREAYEKLGEKEEERRILKELEMLKAL